MSETNKVSVQIRFVDLMNKPLSNLYHEVRVSGDKYAASAGKSNAEGLGVSIKKPIGTQLDILVRHPLTKKLIPARHRVIVPDKKGIFRVQAPFSIQTVKLRALNETIGDYLRKTHVVKPEETLSSIAQTYGMNWQQIAQLNNLKDPYTIQPKDVLKLPPKNARQQSASQSNSSNSPQNSDIKVATTYKVKENETLSGISQRSGVSVEQIQRMNGIKDPKTLQAGQTIKLRGDGSAQSHTTPQPSPTPTAQPRSTTTPSDEEDDGLFDGALDTISDAAKGAIGAIGGAAEWIGENVKEGFEGVNDAMSGGKNDKPAGKAPSSSSNNASSTSGNYTVKSGDSLGAIAQQYGVNTNELARANGLSLTDTIHPGNKLKIPSKSASSSQSSSTHSSNGSSNNLPIETQTSEDRGQTGTPKVDVTKLGDCSCNRDLTLSELEEVIRQLRGGSNIEIFNHSKCTLGSSERNTQSLLTELNKVFKKYDINTCIRRIHFLAQTYHESAGFTTTTEFSDGTKYNPGRHDDAIDNGNTQIGDGPKYRGRGLMQLTWKNNYKYYKAFSGTDVVINYRLVSTSLAIGADAAGWFWKQGKILSKGERWKGPREVDKPNFIKDEKIDYPKTKVSAADRTYHTIDMNLIADQDVVDLISYLINGGENGKNDRRKNVTTLKAVFKYPSKCISTGVEKPTIQTSGGVLDEMKELVDKHIPYSQAGVRNSMSEKGLSHLDCSETVAIYLYKLGITSTVVSLSTLYMTNLADFTKHIGSKNIDLVAESESATFKPERGDIFVWRRSDGVGHCGIVYHVDHLTDVVTILEAIGNIGSADESLNRNNPKAHSGTGVSRTSMYSRTSKALVKHAGWIGYYRPKNYTKVL